jgi:hypothetical protein
VDDPAGTFTEEGTVSAGLLAESDTLAPPVGAGPARLRVQLEDAPASRFVELQDNAEISNGAFKVKVTVREAPFRTAVMVADWLVVIEPAVALNVVEVAPAGTVIEAGRVSAGLLVESPIVLPPVGAASLSVSVQVAAPPELMLLGLHDRVETTAGSIKLRVTVCNVPFRVAVTVALWFDGRAPAVAMKLAELAPAGTVTEEGSERSALLSDSATVVPEEAAWFKLTVQVVEAPAVKVPGLQLKEVTLTGARVVIVPPVAVIGSRPPDGVAPNALVMPIEAVVVPGAMVALTTATTPFGMLFAFRSPVSSPVRKQV